MSRLELKIPPVIVLGLAGALMWSLTRLLPNLTVLESVQGWWRPVFAFGVLLAASGVIQFALSRTTVDPHRADRASSLVTGGIYRLTRNPMYLGMLVVLIGAGLRFGNLGAFVAIPLFAAYMNRFQIEPEERALTAKFGEEYLRFLGRTRRWL